MMIWLVGITTSSFAQDEKEAKGFLMRYFEGVFSPEEDRSPCNDVGSTTPTKMYSDLERLVQRADGAQKKNDDFSSLREKSTILMMKRTMRMFTT